MEADADNVRAGLVRLFRIGWHILQHVPQHVTRQLVSALRSREVTAQLYDRKWILAEVDATLDELSEQVENRQFGEAKTSLALVSLVIDEKLSDALTQMICDYPRYPLDDELRYLESMLDLENIDQFLATLADHAKH